MLHNSKLTKAREAVKAFALARNAPDEDIDIPIHGVSQMVYDFARDLDKLALYFCCPYDEPWCKEECEDEKLDIVDHVLFGISKKMRILLSMTFGKNWSRRWLRNERNAIRELKMWYPTMLTYAKTSLYRLHMIDAIFRENAFDYSKMVAE